MTLVLLVVAREPNREPALSGLAFGGMAPARSWAGDNRLHALPDKSAADPPGGHCSADTAARDDRRRAGVATREALFPVERSNLGFSPGPPSSSCRCSRSPMPAASWPARRAIRR
jgi:hypothetical protein